MSGISVLLLIFGVLVVLSGLFMVVSRKKMAPNMTATQGWGHVSPGLVALMGVAQMIFGGLGIAIVIVFAVLP